MVGSTGIDNGLEMMMLLWMRLEVDSGWNFERRWKQKKKRKQRKKEKTRFV